MRDVTYNNEVYTVLSADTWAWEPDQNRQLTINTGYRYTYAVYRYWGDNGARNYWIEARHDAEKDRHGFSWNGFDFYVKRPGSFRTPQEAIEAAIIILRQVRNQ
jgi:hypothetical protein